MNFSFRHISWLLFPSLYVAQGKDYFFPPALFFLRGLRNSFFPVFDKFRAPMSSYLIHMEMLFFFDGNLPEELNFFDQA